MKQPRIISKISQSFVNPAYYKVYLKESVVKAILFIMFISILFSIPNMILMTIEAKQSVTVFENINCRPVKIRNRILIGQDIYVSLLLWNREN
jgi:hypothetical protein